MLARIYTLNPVLFERCRWNLSSPFQPAEALLKPRLRPVWSLLLPP